ncbi:MAG: cyclic-di-AMP receptor [Chloroflexi bacterium]|nr:cyclic-di-AMP receptor [Chloroflexota bacterium]
MKLIMSIVNGDDKHGLTEALKKAGFQSTVISTTGGFLREGNATVMIGVEDARVAEVLNIIRDNCHRRTQYVNPLPPVMEPGELYMPNPVEVEVGGATIFVINVERAERV